MYCNECFEDGGFDYNIVDDDYEMLVGVVCLSYVAKP
jgi:hypothetical protein